VVFAEQTKRHVRRGFRKYRFSPNLRAVVLTSRIAVLLVAVAMLLWPAVPARALGSLPDGRVVTPIGFTIPVEGFASSAAMSPDRRWLAVLSQDGGAIDVLSVGEDALLVDRIAAPFASGMTWTADGLYVTRGYTGLVDRYRYDAASKGSPSFTARPQMVVGGLLNGVAEDPATHRLIVARTAAREVDIIDDMAGTFEARLHATGQPFSVGFSGDAIIATLYDSDHVDVWHGAPASPLHATIATGPHPTALLVDAGTAYVANADGHDVAAIDLASRTVKRRFDLARVANALVGQTPSGMALSSDRKSLFVAESGLNDVAVVDTASGKVAGRIPTGWYPMSVVSATMPTIDKDPRDKAQLWIVSAQGLGTQPDPGSEWDGWYTGIVQHIVVEPAQFGAWSDIVARDDRFAQVDSQSVLPPIKHFVFIVEENKHFDEIFGDEPRADADPALLLYGRRYTPNAHALAERYTLFDDFMGDGEKSDFGHSWTTQGMANDYLMRNNHTPDDPASASDLRVAFSIWPIAEAGEDSVPIATMNFDWYRDLSELPDGPRVNVSAVFGPRGELIDELQRKGVSYRVYGEQMTMLPDGRIAAGLAAHADRMYPGAHIDFDVLDTQRAKLFLDDVAAHGLAAYSYLTLPTDHTAGTKAGFYTPASYVASNDLALGEIIQGLSQRADWRSTVVFVTMDDPQGTGDHVDSHRMPAFAMGPYVRAGFIDHVHYSIPSVLRTVEVLYGLAPLNAEDAAATPLTAAFSDTARVATYTALPMQITMQRNPGKAKSLSMEIDGPGSIVIPEQEWRSIRGDRLFSAQADPEGADSAGDR
jgi:YVTN family beta-propeller protein